MVRKHASVDEEIEQNYVKEIKKTHQNMSSSKSH